MYEHSLRLKAQCTVGTEYGTIYGLMTESGIIRLAGNPGHGPRTARFTRSPTQAT